MEDGVAIRFDGRELMPAVVQDANTGEVLMVAWMNEEALRRTQETGQAHFWSRSRQELWRKGATSGNVMYVREMWVDCDADTLLLKVDPAGPACHTGERSCFYRRLPPSSPPLVGEESILHTLFATILDRQANPRPGSYTARLLAAGEDEILKKVGEEAMEVVLAAKGQGNERLISEVADLLYHLLVLLAARGVTLADVEAELVRRRR
nr:bifunctional phosphoribosyl-AMP cyclohydrolase/phosphoribosyl-ATP diphosphatase HisIE [Anaerolineae bacterium]